MVKISLKLQIILMPFFCFKKSKEKTNQQIENLCKDVEHIRREGEEGGVGMFVRGVKGGLGGGEDVVVLR